MGAYSQRLGFAFAHVRQRRTFVPRVALLPLAPQIKQWLLMRPHHLASEVKLSLCELALAPAHLTVRRLGTVAAPLLHENGC